MKNIMLIRPECPFVEHHVTLGQDSFIKVRFDPLQGHAEMAVQGHGFYGELPLTKEQIKEIRRALKATVWDIDNHQEQHKERVWDIDNPQETA